MLIRLCGIEKSREAYTITQASHHQSIVQQFHGPPTRTTKIFAPENAKQDVALHDSVSRDAPHLCGSCARRKKIK
jgi:hypothetical protein